MGAARSLVYFAYLGDAGAEDALIDRRLPFMARQLAWLAALIERADYLIEVTVPYVAPERWDAAIERVVSDHGFQVDPAAIASERRNSHEYPGFRALKTLADRSPPEHLIYYCHSKGIVDQDASKMGLFRLHTEVGLTADLTPMIADPGINRAGLFPYKCGWIWYNFFWIKAGYMATRTVTEHPDRYHYEELIGDRADREGYRSVLPLLDRLPDEATGIAPRPWYLPEHIRSAALRATYDRYAEMDVPAPAIPTGSRG